MELLFCLGRGMSTYIKRLIAVLIVASLFEGSIFTVFTAITRIFSFLLY